jgi:hypothetical protein
MATRFTIKSVFEAIDRMSGPVDKMTRNMGRMQAVAAKVSGGVGRVFRVIGKTFLGVTAAAGAATLAFNKLVVPFAEKGDEIAKTSRMLGLSSDALQELRYAAGLQGVETEALNTGFKLMNKNLGELQSGQGMLYARLKVTNPQLARQLKNVEGTEEAFLLLMGALKAETNVARRAALAQAAFGRSGQELIKFAEAGEEGIKALRKEAHLYGAVISADAAKSSEEFSDSLDRLKKSGTGVVYEVLGRIVEKMQPVIQAMADWVAANRDLISQKIDKLFENVGKGIDILVKAWDSGLIQSILAAAAAFKILGAAMAISNMSPIMLTIGALSAMILLIINNWDKITGFFDRITGSGKSRADIYGLGSGSPLGAQGAAMYPQAAQVAATTQTVNNRSQLDVNFNQMPAGTVTKQTGSAPGINVNTGPTLRDPRMRYR